MANSDYKPRMCGYCRNFEKNELPNTPGKCLKYGYVCLRIDYCHKPQEIAKHEAAMAAYIPQGAPERRTQ